MFKLAPCRDNGIIEILHNGFCVSPLALWEVVVVLRAQTTRKNTHTGKLPIEPCWVCKSDFIMAFKSNEVIIWGCSLSLCVTVGDWLLCTHVLAYTLFVPKAYLYHAAYLICMLPSQRHSCLRLGNHCILTAPLLSNCCRYKDANLEAGVPRNSTARWLKDPSYGKILELEVRAPIHLSPLLFYCVWNCRSVHLLTLGFPSVK